MPANCASTCPSRTAGRRSPLIELDRIAEGRIRELIKLDRATWWAAGETVEEVRTLVRHSDVVIGLVDDVSDRLVAFAGCSRIARTLRSFFGRTVAEERRGTGIGHTLMARVLARPELHDVRSVELICRPDVVTFYDQFGFSTNVGSSLLMRRTSDTRLQNPPGRG